MDVPVRRRRLVYNREMSIADLLGRTLERASGVRLAVLFGSAATGAAR